MLHSARLGRVIVVWGTCFGRPKLAISIEVARKPATLREIFPRVGKMVR